jgi:hypothetical protein
MEGVVSVLKKKLVYAFNDISCLLFILCVNANNDCYYVRLLISWASRRM